METCGLSSSALSMVKRSRSASARGLTPSSIAMPFSSSGERRAWTEWSVTWTWSGAHRAISRGCIMRKPSEKPLLTLVEAGGVNDMPVIVPAAIPNDALVEAIKTLRAAGYRVSKPRKQKNPKRGTDRVGPTCVAMFADGEVTRMSTFTTLERLDWERGLRLSQAAYESRWRTRVRVHGVPPLSALPPIIS